MLGGVIRRVHGYRRARLANRGIAPGSATQPATSPARHAHPSPSASRRGTLRDMAAVKCPANPRKTIASAVDRLIPKLRACPSTPDLDAVIRHLTAARNVNQHKPGGKGRIGELRAEIARLNANPRWRGGPKIAEARRKLRKAILDIVRPLIEKGYGTPAKPLTPAFQAASGLSADEARTVVESMLRSGCLIYPKGMRRPAIHEDACE